MEEIIWKILHVPTGLYYSTKKGRFKDKITNLSQKGNHYTKEAYAIKIMENDCKHASINKAQTEKHNLEITDSDAWSYNYAKQEDFKIQKFKLTLVE